LELLDQPAIIIVYTPKEETAKKYKIPKSIFDNTPPWPKGIITQPIKATTNVKMGDKTKIIGLLLLGITVSFIKSFAPSAPACNIPKVPTILGPRRRCTDAINLRSKTVKKATATNKNIIIIRLFKIMETNNINIFKNLIF